MMAVSSTNWRAPRATSTFSSTMPAYSNTPRSFDMTDADCETMFRTNVLASFRITHRVAKSMVERRRGRIIVMTSIAAREVYRLGVIYCATKHALSAFARGLRIELQGHGIKVTEIAPGMVDT